MKKTSRLLILMLVVTMLITSLLPVNTVFAGKSDEVESVEVKTIGAQRLYVERTLNSGDYFTTKSSAARELRKTLVARGSSVTIPYKIDCDDIGNERDYIIDLMSDLYDRATAHTGEPTEGDSLKWSLKKATTYAEYYIKSGYCYVRITYDITYHSTASQETALTKEVNRLVGVLGLDDDISDYQKICNIYDYITENVKYDYDHLGDDSYTLKHTAYAAAINKKAVCQGYCLLFYRLALEAGVDARLIAGTGRDDGHAWNIVQLDGEYYLLDCTWDAGRSKYSWFLKSEADFSSHTDTMGSSFWKDYPLAKVSYDKRIEIPDKPVCTVTVDAASGLPLAKWNAVEGAVKYELYGSTVKTGTYKLITTTTKTQYVDTAGIIGKPYYYYVHAIGYSGKKSEASDLKGAYCVCAQPVVTPSTVAATGKPTIKWSAITNAVKYEIYCSTVKNGTYNLVATTTKTQHVQEDAVVGKPYYFKVYAIDSTGRKSVTSALKGAYCVCAKPVISSIKLTSAGKPSLKWGAVDGAVKYEVYRATSKSGTYSLAFTATKPQYTNTGATTGKTYYYKVRAVDAGGRYSAFSDIVNNSKPTSTTTTSSTGVPAKPTITLKADAATGKPVISWSKLSNAAKYEVYRSTSSSGTFSKVGTVTDLKFTDTSAAVGKKYYYKVRGLNSAGKAGSYCSAKYVTCDCARPTVSIALNSKKKPRLTWKAVSGASKYEVYRATSKNGTYKLMKTTTDKAYTNTSAKAGTTYYYKVRAICKATTNGNSAYSEIKYIKSK